VVTAPCDAMRCDAMHGAVNCIVYLFALQLRCTDQARSHACSNACVLSLQDGVGDFENEPARYRSVE
jgi:hypothetical protein